MKKITFTITALTLVIFLLTGFIQSKEQQDNKPKAVYQTGDSKVVVWVNEKDDGSTWKNFQIEKVYKKEGKWESTNTFNKEELLDLKLAIEEAISKEIESNQ